MARPALTFGVEEAQRCYDEWRFNCGPGALCAITGCTPEQALEALPQFRQRGYTNPTMMRKGVLRLAFAIAELRTDEETRFPHGFGDAPWPEYGLVRIQWDGRWCEPGVPIVARYRHTHWVATDGDQVFDINATCVGGWIGRTEWSERLLPWLMKECAPKATGWYPTHCWRLAANGR